jgi:hypothetical protein
MCSSGTSTSMSLGRYTANDIYTAGMTAYAPEPRWKRYRASGGARHPHVRRARCTMESARASAARRARRVTASCTASSGTAARLAASTKPSSFCSVSFRFPLLLTACNPDTLLICCRTRKKSQKVADLASRKLIKDTSKSCPGCKRRIEKNGGCDHITCKS